MPVQILSLQPGDLGADYCFTTFQRLNVDIVSRIQATLNTSLASYWNVGSTTPSQNYRAFPWFNTGDGYVYWWNQSYGVWTALPPLPDAGPNGFRWDWEGIVNGSPSGLWSMSGGDGTDPTVSGNVTPISGSFWTVDPNYAARIAIGPGTLPSGTVIAAGTTDGEETHELTKAELPDITVDIEVRGGTTEEVDAGNLLVVFPIASTFPEQTLTAPLGGSGTAHNNMPPYRGIYKIKRTSRRFLAIPG